MFFSNKNNSMLTHLKFQNDIQKSMVDAILQVLSYISQILPRKGGSFHGNVNFKFRLFATVSDRLLSGHCVHLAAIGAMLIGPYRCLQVAKHVITVITRPHGMTLAKIALMFFTESTLNSSFLRLR